MVSSYDNNSSSVTLGYSRALHADQILFEKGQVIEGEAKIIIILSDMIYNYRPLIQFLLYSQGLDDMEAQPGRILTSVSFHQLNLLIP